jgi:hypothetical protein
MASCTRCGRPCESNDDGLVLLSTCPCIKLPSLEVVDGRLVDYPDDEDYERDRKLCMDQDDDKEYRLGIRGDK